MAESIFSDTRDGQTYRLFEQNSMIWMVDNLNYLTDNSWWYQDNEAYGKEYGRLYTWDAALEACPPGWRLPSDDELQELIAVFGGVDSGYKALIDGGVNAMNFKLGGYRDINGKFGRIGAFGGYWTENEKNAERALGINFDSYYEKIDFSDALKASGKSCRCVKIK